MRLSVSKEQMPKDVTPGNAPKYQNKDRGYTVSWVFNFVVHKYKSFLV